MKVVLVLLLIFGGINFISSQTQQQYCGFNLIPGLNKSNVTSAPIPHSGTFRVLLVYCKFSDDTYDSPPTTDGWPSNVNSMPSWGPSVLSATVQPSYTNPSISGFFDVMSTNTFDVIGDEYFYQPLHNESYYWTTSGRHIGYLVEEILTDLDVNQGVNFANYDNDNDGTVDMIAICFRVATFLNLDGTGSYQGIAGLTGTQNKFSGNKTALNFDGKIVSAGALGSGIILRQIYDAHGLLRVFSHEFGHYLFENEGHFNYVGNHGLMDGNGNGILSSYEREKLGWVTPQVVNSNLIGENINDALSTNDIYKIPIPGTDYYFLVDNHLRQNYYESSWREYLNGPLISKGTGILVSLCWPSNMNIKSAFGNWDWEMSGSVWVYPFQIHAANILMGDDKLHLRNMPTTSGTKSHPDCLGSQDDFFTTSYNHVIAPWTNPYSGHNSDNNTGVSIVAKGNSTVDFYVNGITVTESTTFSSIAQTYNKNLIIPSGVVVRINSGTILKFKEGATLIVQDGGSLIADGTSSKPITFEFTSPNSTTQNGIIFNSGSSGNINYCIVRNAYRGIYENNAAVNVTNSAISNCTDGIYLYNSNQAVIQQCNIHNNSNAGIYLLYSSPFLQKNYIQNNITGVFCSTNSSPLFGNGSDGSGNYISNNTNGIISVNNAVPRLGDQLPTIGGWNNLVNITYNIVNTTSNVIYARNNWWGSTNPANFLITGGPVTYSPYLSSLVNIQAPPLSKSNENATYANEDIPMLSELDRAYQLADSKNYKEAREICLNLVNNYPDYSVSFNALNLLKDTYNEKELSDKKNTYETLFNSKNRKDLYALAGVLLSDIDKNNKIKHLDDVLTNYIEGKAAELALFNKFVFYYFEKEDIKNALVVSKQIDERFPNSNVSIEAHKILGDEEYFNEGVSLRETRKEKTIGTAKENPIAYELFGNYPNPFNPVTTIKYAIPQNSKVVLEIYSILGERAALLVNEVKSAGYQEVQFNADNLPSGIYIYRLTAASTETGERFVKSAKMLLLK